MATFLEQRYLMDPLIIIAIVLLIAWVLGAFAFHVAGGLIHILLVIALIVIIYRVVTRKKVI
jgi:hypothetical protein